MATLTEVLAKVKGPPPVLQQVLIPFGSLVGVAAKVPNAQVSEQVLLAKFPSSSVLLLVSSLDSCGPARGGGALRRSVCDRCALRCLRGAILVGGASGGALGVGDR